MEVIGDLSSNQKIKHIRKITGCKTKLSWAALCSLTEFDSFATCFSFGINWNENCPNDRLVTMNDSYLNMIIHNVTHYPKCNDKPAPSGRREGVSEDG